MALERLYNNPKPVTRFYLASPLAFADWQNPTAAELNANPTNNPNGLIWNLTCAIAQDDTTHDLGDSDTDDALSFCQIAGAANPTSYNPEISWSIFRDANRWIVSDTDSESVANLAFSLLAWRGVEYFAIASVGKAYDQPFAAGDRIKSVRVATDYMADVVSSGESVRNTQSFLNRGDITWNTEVA